MSSDSLRSLRASSGTCYGYRDAGDLHAPTLLQVHGLGTGHGNYDLLTPELSRILRVIDIDLPGYGGSDQRDDRRTLPDFAADVGEFIEAIELGAVAVHGTSMGGAIAMLLASARPDLVSRLVVSCSFGRFDRAARVMFDTWRWAADDGIDALALVTSQQGFSRGFWDRPESSGTREAFVAALSRTTPADFIRDLAAMEHADVSDAARRIRVPTLLLGAAEDAMTPLDAADSGVGMRALHCLIPGSVLEVLPACGHFISIERPREVAQAICRFVLSEQRPVGAA